MAVLLALVVALPGGSAQAAELPSGWKSYTVGDIQFGLPQSWKSIPLEKADLERMTKEIEKNNPDLARVLQQLIQSGQYKLLKFFAIDIAKGQNINVGVTPVGVALTPKQIVAVLKQQLQDALPNAELLETKDNLTINGLPAARVIYDLTITGESGSKQIVRGIQYYIPVAKNLHVVTISGDTSKEFRALADQISTTLERASTPPSEGLNATVRTAGNVRAAPATSGKIIDKLGTKDSVVLLGKNKAGTWLKITTPRGVTGWAAASLLKVDPAVLKQLKVVQ
jgi:hypothetical protein